MAEYVLIHERDNVVTAIRHLDPGRVLHISCGEDVIDITLKSRIPFGHKCAIRRIPKGEKVIKYGESIGLASQDIEPGEHVHIHNLRSIRGSVKEIVN
jgi:altronate dehydratase small subunit